MKIALTVGHSRLKNGSYTSADGKPYGGCNEYKWCKAFSKQLAKQLKKNGHDVDTIICPEKTFTSSKQEKPHKLDIINTGSYELVMELHLNAASPSANGCEVLYVSDKGREYASAIQKRLATIFRDRGIVKRNDLYMLNSTNPPAILIETFFCTNRSDYKKGKGLKKRKKLAKLIAEGIQKA